jgi:hypothetical protein
VKFCEYTKQNILDYPHFFLISLSLFPFISLDDQQFITERNAMKLDFSISQKLIPQTEIFWTENLYQILKTTVTLAPSASYNICNLCRLSDPICKKYVVIQEFP